MDVRFYGPLTGFAEERLPFRSKVGDERGSREAEGGGNVSRRSEGFGPVSEAIGLGEMGTNEPACESGDPEGVRRIELGDEPGEKEVLLVGFETYEGQALVPAFNDLPAGIAREAGTVEGGKSLDAFPAEEAEFREG